MLHLNYLMRSIDPQSLWTENLKAFVKAFPDMPHVSIQDMGFPEDWETHAFWK
jgi:hypothetical protein